MPLIPGSFTYPLLTSLPANGIAGVAVPQLATALDIALRLYFQSRILTTVDTGTVGPGTGTGTITLTDAVGLPLFLSAFASNGLNGTSAPGLAQGILTGISLGIVSATVQTVNPAVATGAFVGTITNIENATLNAGLLTAFGANTLTGTSIPNLANAISIAVNLWLPSALIVGTIVGTPVGPGPITGAGTGIIL